ncbi:MAG: MurR/RpiR family transcriptional regulator [Veillonellales bacterium]
MDKTNLIRILKENYNKYTGRQKKICKYILDHYETVAFMSAVELSEVVGVSDVTIIRFVRNLGFSGYVEFKKHMREGAKNFEAPDSRVSKTLHCIDKRDPNMQVYSRDLDNLKRFMETLDKTKIRQIIDEIYKAKTIYLFGMGSAAILVDFLVLHLRRMGFSVVAVTEGGAENSEKLFSITAEDVLITCSFPRYSKGSYNAILFAKEKCATRITITDSVSSILSINSDMVVPIQIDNITFFNSYVVPMEFCNILIMNILERNGEKIQEKIKENMRCLEKFDIKL